MASVSVKLPDSLKKQIEDRTEEEGYMNTSEYIRQAVREKIREETQLYPDELKRLIKQGGNPEKGENHSLKEVAEGISRHEEAFKDFAETAKEDLGDSLEELILYGSVARGEENEDSDVDVFAVVESEEDLEHLRDLAFDLGVLKHGVSISVQGELSENFTGLSDTSYLRNIDRDGVKYA